MARSSLGGGSAPSGGYGDIADLEQAAQRMNANPFYGWRVPGAGLCALTPEMGGEFCVNMIYPQQALLRQNAGSLPQWMSALSNLAQTGEKGKDLVLNRIPACLALSELPSEDFHWLFKVGLHLGGWASCAWPAGRRWPQGSQRPPVEALDVSKPLSTPLHQFLGPECGEPVTVEELPHFAEFRRIFGLPFDAPGAEAYAELADPAGRSRIARREEERVLQKLVQSRAGGQLKLDLSVPDAAAYRNTFFLVTCGMPQTPMALWSLGFRLHNIYTQEFVQALSLYLKDRLESYGPDAGPIVEVGAGFGVLAQALNSTGLRVLASSLEDSWPNHFGVELPPHGVKKEDQRQTVARVKPSIILCAWMPQGEDWTPAWRKQPSVREYLVIGCPPSDLSPACGTPAAWCMGGEDNDQVVNPQGWQATGIPQVSRWSMCYADGDYPFSLANVISVRRT